MADTNHTRAGQDLPLTDAEIQQMAEEFADEVALEAIASLEAKHAKN